MYHEIYIILWVAYPVVFLLIEEEKRNLARQAAFEVAQPKLLD